MDKRKILKIFFIIGLAFSLIFGVHNFLIQKQQKHTANEELKYDLKEIQGCFVVDYKKLADEDKNYYYMKAATNLHTALFIIDLNSNHNISNRNEELFNAIYSLYVCMTEESYKNNIRLKIVTEKENEISNYLYFISMNLNDKKDCKALSKLINDLDKNNQVINPKLGVYGIRHIKE